MMQVMWSNILLFCISLCLGCGVNVGNPNSEDDTKTKLRIEVAPEQSDDGQALSFSLTEMSISNDSEESFSLAPSAEDVSVIGEVEDETIEISEFQEVEPGDYTKIIFNLNEEKPFKYRRKKGQDLDLDFEDRSVRSFELAQSFTVVEGEENVIVISFDAMNSISMREGGESFLFKPRSHLFPKRQKLEFKGELTVSAEWVCAYLYDPKLPKHRPFGKEPTPEMKERFKAKFPNVYKTKEEVQKDEDSNCNNAFRRVPVKDGKFKLKHLLPGSYTIRSFDSEGVYDDSYEDFTLDVPKRPKKDRPIDQ